MNNARWVSLRPAAYSSVIPWYEATRRMRVGAVAAQYSGGRLLCWCRSSRKFGLSPGKWQAKHGNGGAWLHSLAPSCLPLILVLSHGNLPLQARGEPSGGLKDKPPIAL